VVNKGAALAYSPSGLVPTLIVTTSPQEAPLTIPDSLSIAEYLAETHAELPLWPGDAHLRALARSAVAEMHAGFTEVRNAYGCNFLGQYSGPIPITQKAKREIERLLALWGDARKSTVERLKTLGQESEDEGFLFGKFGIADSFFWPVLWVCLSLFLRVRSNSRDVGANSLASASGRITSLLIRQRQRLWPG
jgi:glutathione S-transferase